MACNLMWLCSPTCHATILNYHGDMAAYAAAKAALFKWPGLRYAVLNMDDEFGRTLAEQVARQQG